MVDTLVMTSVDARLEAGKMAKARPVTGLTTADVVDFILTADQSFFRFQARKWLEEPTAFMGPNTGDLYRRAFRFITASIDQGFDGKVWWPPEEIVKPVNGTDMHLAVMVEYLILADVIFRLKLIREGTDYRIAQGFDVFTEIVLGRDWPRLYAGLTGKLLAYFEDKSAFKEALLTNDQKLLDLLKQELDLAGPVQSCINEFCERGVDGVRKMVDTTKRKSGACSRACMSFECSHESCLARAIKAGWPRATHRWGTKIAQNHKEYRVAE